MSFFFGRGKDILRSGRAARVIFYYPLDEETFIDNPYVTMYRNGIVEIRHEREEVCTHIQNIEVVWSLREDQPPVKNRNLVLHRFDHRGPGSGPGGPSGSPNQPQ